MSGIFISYRRQDSAPYAGRLYDRLSEVFGPDNVFMDVDDIDPGADFASLIEQKVTSCDALVAVIGRNWPASGEAQRSRLDDPHDFVRLELELALRRNVLVIPVLVEGALMPAANDIPAGLHEFTQRQAVELSDRDFNHGFEKLLNALETVPALSAAKPREKGTESRVSTQPGRLSRNFLTAVLLLALGLGVYWFFSDRSGQNLSIAGRWRGFVSYSWGASYNEEFRFEPQGSRLLGTASFLGYDRAIEEGRIDRDQITFKVRFDQVSGGSTSTHVNRYTGKIALHSIDFVLEDDRGNLPVRFNATRSD